MFFQVTRRRHSSKTLVGNTGLLDDEIDLAGPEGLEGMLQKTVTQKMYFLKVSRIRSCCVQGADKSARRYCHCAAPSCCMSSKLSETGNVNVDSKTGGFELMGSGLD